MLQIPNNTAKPQNDNLNERNENTKLKHGLGFGLLGELQKQTEKEIDLLEENERIVEDGAFQ